METLKVQQKAKKKGCLYYGVVTVLCIVVSIFIAALIVTQCEGDENKPVISGFDPYLSSLALKEIGFDRNTDYGGEFGDMITCTRHDYGIQYVVTMFMPYGYNEVQNFRASIMVEPGIENIQSGLFMIKFLAGAKYDTCDPVRAENWAQENYDNDGATITIGDARFTINAPSEYVRMLTIDKAPADTLLQKDSLDFK